MDYEYICVKEQEYEENNKVKSKSADVEQINKPRQFQKDVRFMTDAIFTRTKKRENM
jgi:hypothetical protein